MNRRTSLSPAQIAQDLARQPDLWRPQIRYDATSRYYTRLASEATHEVWLLSWLPGQGTDWHDHGGSAGAFVTLQGVLTERHAAISSTRALTPLPQPRRLTTGNIRPFGARHVHRVTNEGTAAAVSLHVYAPALTEMNEYEVNGSSLEQVAARLAGVSW